MEQNFTPFAQERVMSKWENVVDYNLGDSGVHPITIRELVDDPGFIEELLSTGLYHPQANGIIELREHVAALYPGATTDNVLVTSGAAQANFTSLWTLLDPGDEVVVVLPNYLQIWGVAHNFGLKVKSCGLDGARDWALNTDELDAVVTDKTRLVAVCNPNNPTGHILTSEEMDAVVAAARRAGAWLLADEVYAGTEHAGDEVTPSFWGRYERVLAIGSMSKAYAMPGVRIGWIVTSEEVVEEIWARQEYVTIGSAMLANKLAAHALCPQVRPRLLARTRSYTRKRLQAVHEVGRASRGSTRLGASTGGAHRAGPVRRPRQLDGLLHAPDPRAERRDRSRGPLRPRRLPADQLRSSGGLPRRGARATVPRLRTVASAGPWGLPRGMRAARPGRAIGVG